MKVLICGAGQVGFGIAERLAAEDNDVAVIDNEPALVHRISDMLDVRGFVGHGAHPDMLDQAGARDADMIIAVTLYDEVNMIACQVAHSLFEIPTKIARVRAQSYLESHWRDLFSRDHMPIDVIISPEIEVGDMVVRRLKLPGAFESASFGDGKISFIGVTCEEDCPVIDTPLLQLTELFPDLPVVVVAIVREGQLFVPRGEDQLLVGDEAYFVVREDQVSRTLKIMGHEEKEARRIVIAGGGNIGLYVADKLESLSGQVRTKIVEADRARAVYIAEQLNRTVVLNGSALDEEILREADIGHADTVVTLTNEDQVNILSAVLAKRLGCKRNLCLINNPGYLTITRSLGIDAYLSPRAVTVSRILQHVRRGRIRRVQSVHNGAGEIIEAEALTTSPLVGTPIKDLALPDGVRIGALLRKDEVIIPHGATIIEPQDRVIIFAAVDDVRAVEHMFRVSLEYF